MEEPRERCVAEILARALERVRQRAERAGVKNSPGDNHPQPATTETAGDQCASSEHAAVATDPGDQ